ncbi:MAG: FimB/Mfa2 family fimbrial subunit [Bacteroides ovatus]
MRPFLLYIISAIALFSSCNWVNDDLSDCPSGTWLKISYTYNILDVDAASTQVSDITILAFDKDDKYVDSVGRRQHYITSRLLYGKSTVSRRNLSFAYMGRDIQPHVPAP